MAGKDNSVGLLARIASLVRTPTAGSVSPVKEDSPEDGKQAIRQMIARKVHNDAIRKREFNLLRQLRQATPTTVSELVARPSFFQDTTGFTDLDERATTLKKIDVIEAQMSKQWWKGRQDAETSSAATPDAPDAPAPHRSSAPDSQAEPNSTFASTLAIDFENHSDDMPTQLGLGSQWAAQQSGVAPDSPVLSRGLKPSENSVFSPSQGSPFEVQQELEEPILEEAAIRFANGDDAGAESVLLLALDGGAAAPESMQAWATALFDMYQGHGQQARFEHLAMDYARWLGRPPPNWAPTPDALAASGASEVAGQALSAGNANPEKSAASDVRHVKLFGDLLGAADDKLGSIELATRDSAALIVHCDGLTRVDFSAAGRLLNCVKNAQSEGKQIEFRHLPRLIATFFNLIGIDEHAQLTVRPN